jgi:hypothetical protein
MNESDRAAQALRILDLLESARPQFKVSPGQSRWLVSVKLDDATHVVSGETLADALAQLAQAVAT